MYINMYLALVFGVVCFSPPVTRTTEIHRVLVVFEGRAKFHVLLMIPAVVDWKDRKSRRVFKMEEVGNQTNIHPWEYTDECLEWKYLDVKKLKGHHSPKTLQLMSQLYRNSQISTMSALSTYLSQVVTVTWCNEIGWSKLLKTSPNQRGPNNL